MKGVDYYYNLFDSSHFSIYFPFIPMCFSLLSLFDLTKGHRDTGMRKTPGGVLVGSRVKSDETLGNGVVVRSLY